MNKDTVEGAVQEAGGKARRVIADVTGDTEAKVQATKDEVAGNAQKNYGKLKDAAKDAASN